MWAPRGAPRCRAHHLPPLRGHGSSLLCSPDGPQAAVSSAGVQLARSCMVSTLGGQTLSLHGVPQAQGAVSGTRHLGLTQPNPRALKVLLSDTHGSGPRGTVSQIKALCPWNKTASKSPADQRLSWEEPGCGKDVSGRAHWGKEKTIKSPNSSLDAK